ncbi:zinc-dependent metalloprotease [Prevotella sp. E15-22]|uniref:zinc-dependent metalloprotease n=1 Tax=Prevotella sp. E15-22 TaxID=2937774 RepID=UPI002066A74B|nr:zinc-dependent metalloprotease [Prevotella sp. E15-22]UPS43709.1 zinc-dependent metalloprotease [Prevotella sp. E15-22]
MRTIALLLGLTLATTTIQARTSYVAKSDTIKQDTVKHDSIAADTAKVEKPKKETEYEKIVKKGGTVMKGLFTVRHIEDKYYFEVPDSMLGRMILCVNRFTAVPQNFGKFAGEEANDITFYLEKRDTTQILVRQYVLTQIAKEGDNIRRTLQQSTINPIVMDLKIIGHNEANDAHLVEVTPMFKGNSKLTDLASSLKTSLKLGAPQNNTTFIDTMKVYPNNIEIVTTRTYAAQNGQSPASQTGNITLGMNTSMVLLPKEPMRGRLWDERVGYFVNGVTLFSDDQHKTQHESFIARYRLVPKDKKKYLRGELTEPEKQIVYYIDPATPKKWLPYLIQGVNDWNVAFEAAGFKNAIVAKVLPEDDPNVSMEDARYSGLRYLPAEIENAYGPHIIDPRSGEIIEAHICWYHNVMNLLTKWYMVQCGPLDKKAQTMKFDDKLMGELIRFVSSHEVGHTLGLRHNMCASNATPVEKLRDKSWVEKNGHTSSIMDYARFNYVAQPEDHVSEKGLFPRINDYDKWAIKWGYQWRPEFKDEYEEKEKLMKETSEVLRNNRRLWWLGGEGWGEDPRAQTEDLGDDAVKASEYGIKNLKRVMDNLPKWTKQDNDQYDDLREMWNAVVDQYSRYMNHVRNNIGGRYNNNTPGLEPYVGVPKERQKEALLFLGRHVFDTPEWLFPDNIMSKNGTNVLMTMSNRQENILSQLMSISRLNGIANTGYPTEEFLNDLFAEVWQKEGDTDLKKKLRRSLQRSYVQNLNDLLNPTAQDQKNYAIQYHTDAILYVMQNLQKVEDYCKQQVQAQSGINKLHYEDLLREIKLIRDRRTTVK